MSEFRTEEAKLGYADYHAGKKFNECPYQGLRPEEITRRWNWQMGWLHAQQEKER